jgi:hypothetical protein
VNINMGNYEQCICHPAALINNQRLFNMYVIAAIGLVCLVVIF